jgi:2-polyprenyl-3-methyl-5-hydroxy-6-metoxy-1,4-benzoquinol methylase
MRATLGSSCLNCGESGFQLKGLRPDYPLLRCGTCGLIFADAWREGFDTSHEDYHEARLSKPTDEIYSPLNLKRLGEVLDGLSRIVPGRRLLDVGCGQGELVYVAQRRGWEARGIDLSESAIEFCKRLGANCSVTDFFSKELDHSTFDLITMSEFIEHVPHPRDVFARAAKLLSPGGLVYLTTPNFASLGRRILQGDWPPIGPGHIALFTPKTLAEVAKASGLGVVRLETRNISLAAVRHLVRRGSRADREAGRREVATESTAQEAVRTRLESSRVLRSLKAAVNAILRVTRSGETIEAVLSGSKPS